MKAPWMHIRHLEGWTWTVAELPDGQLGVTDCGARTITIDPRQSTCAFAATAIHEAIHARRGPTWEDEAHEEEWLVEDATARLLILLEDLAAAVRATSRRDEQAARLGVDATLLRARLRGLTWGERALMDLTTA